MAKQRSTHQKREREMKKRQRQQLKATRKAEKKELRPDGPAPVIVIDAPRFDDEDDNNQADTGT